MPPGIAPAASATFSPAFSSSSPASSRLPVGNCEPSEDGCSLAVSFPEGDGGAPGGVGADGPSAGDGNDGELGGDGVGEGRDGGVGVGDGNDGGAGIGMGTGGTGVSIGGSI